MSTPSDGKDINADRVIVLAHVPHLFVVNVPGRDLDDGDIARLVALDKEARELIPREYDDDGKEIEKPITARTVKAALIATGAYAAVEQAKPDEKATKPAVPKPDAPASKE